MGSAMHKLTHTLTLLALFTILVSVFTDKRAEMPRFLNMFRTRRRWRRSRCITYTISIFCILVIFGIYLDRTTMLRRDIPYILRPFWDTAPGNFTLIDPIAYPVRHEPEAQRRRCEKNGWIYKKTRPRVIDAVIFSNELDILEVRIRELWDIVDLFVVLESDRTFTGHPKPYFFDTHRSRFRFADAKIKTAQVTTLTPLKPGQNPFDNETEMRRQMNHFLRSSDVDLRAGDLLIVSDVDEIPRNVIISLLKTCVGWPNPLMLQMRNYLYSFEFTTLNHVWRPKIRRIQSGDVEVYTRARSSNDLLTEAGWHCSFCFRYIEDFIFKMQAYSHADRVTDQKLLEKTAIQKKICNGNDIFDMYPEEYTLRKLKQNWNGAHRAHRTDDLPQSVLQNPARFRFLLPGGCNRTTADHVNHESVI